MAYIAEALIDGGGALTDEDATLICGGHALTSGTDTLADGGRAMIDGSNALICDADTMTDGRHTMISGGGAMIDGGSARGDDGFAGSNSRFNFK